MSLPTRLLSGAGNGRRRIRLALVFLIATAGSASAQRPADTATWSRRNTFGFFGAWANDSSHILLGDAVNRRLLNLGVSWNRRLLLRRHVLWYYEAEFMPVALDSDPLQKTAITYTSTDPNLPGTNTVHFADATVGPCHPSSGSGSLPNFYTYTYVATCQRRWTIGQAMTPFGLRWNYRPARRLQPFLDGHGGFMYSTQPIPVATAGSFNFLFDIGAGFEWYRSHSHSIRFEYRYHHLSNDNTAPSNPGIDNGLFQLTWAFGR